MRDPARIDRILALLGDIWRRNPDMRLFQLLENAVPPSGSGDWYHVEDALTEERLRDYYRRPVTTPAPAPVVEPETKCGKDGGQ